MNSADENIIDVDHREEVLKGKVPRRLLWILGVAFMISLMVIAVFIVNGSDGEKKKNDDDDAIAAKLAAAKPQVKTVDALESDQTKDALLLVKGGGPLPTEIDKMRGVGLPSQSSVQATVTQNGPPPVNPEIEAKRRRKEQIATAGIFKGGKGALGVGVQTVSAQAPANDGGQNAELLKAINPANMLNAMNAQSAKASASGELEFNAAMASKNLPEPTGLMAKSKNACLLTPGWLIPVANVEGMNSDIPGEVTAMVREDVYDSLTNTCLAIPKGSKILMTYNPNVKVGQERFNVAASVLYLPNGKKVPMLGTGGYDREGYAGLGASVNNHFFQMLGTSLLLGLISKVTGNDAVSTTSANGTTTTNTTVLGKIIGESASTVLERNKVIQPTLERKQGMRFNLKVSREFFMEPYRE